MAFPKLRFLVLIVALATTAFAQAQAQVAQTGSGTGATPPALLLAPIPGLTTTWHPAPTDAAIPVGTELLLRQPAPASAIVTWEGAVEVGRDAGGSTAACPVNAPGRLTVRVTVEVSGTSAAALGLAEWQNECRLAALPIDVEDIVLEELDVWGHPFAVDPGSDVNAQTVAAWFGPSIAALEAVGEGHYLTSVQRLVRAEVRVTPAALAPLIEWRVDGEAVGLGLRTTSVFTSVGRHAIEVGPPASNRRALVDTYRVKILSPYEALPTDEMLTFVAETDPPGLEQHVTWMASTKHGTAAPITASGAVFRARFEDVVGSDGSWFGVKADNATLGQDGPFNALAAFFGPDTTLADLGYQALFAEGLSSIGPLIASAGTPGNWAGLGFHNANSSRLRMDPAPKGLMALYLVDAIIRQELWPYQAPILFDDTPQPSSASLDDAIAAYVAWWLLNQGLTLPQLQAAPHPLIGTLLNWVPLFFPPIIIPVTGFEVPDSETPGKRTAGGSMICTDTPDTYSWELEPDEATGPVPYNCLAWAVNCDDDRWTQPDNSPGNTWQEILDDHGYDATAPVACAGACPAGTGPKIKMVFQWRLAPPFPFIEYTWVHAMKHQDNGLWTSKNGQGSKWVDIIDCAAFLDEHYPVPAGFFRDVQCFCK